MTEMKTIEVLSKRQSNYKNCEDKDRKECKVAKRNQLKRGIVFSNFKRTLDEDGSLTLESDNCRQREKEANESKSKTTVRDQHRRNNMLMLKRKTEIEDGLSP